MSAQAEKLQTVTVERVIAQPPEKIWRALTQPALIEEWLMPNDFKPEIGHKFQLRGEWGGTLDCRVLKIKPYETLVYAWNFAHEDPAYRLESTVTFTLTPTDGGTRLRMQQSGFRPGQRQAIGGAKKGWMQFLENLDRLLTRAA